MTSSSSNPFAIRIRPMAALSAGFDLSSAAGGSNLPFTLGYAFRQGDIPAGAQAVGNLAALQVVPKNAWPDGSLKFAVVSGLATIAAGGVVTVVLGVGTGAAGA